MFQQPDDPEIMEGNVLLEKISHEFREIAAEVKASEKRFSLLLPKNSQQWERNGGIALRLVSIRRLGNARIQELHGHPTKGADVKSALKPAVNEFSAVLRDEKLDKSDFFARTADHIKILQELVK